MDAIGACIGPKGARVNTIVEELGGEKIDVVNYSDDPAAYISAALSPASPCRITSFRSPSAIRARTPAWRPA